MTNYNVELDSAVKSVYLVNCRAPELTSCRHRRRTFRRLVFCAQQSQTLAARNQPVKDSENEHIAGETAKHHPADLAENKGLGFSFDIGSSPGLLPLFKPLLSGYEGGRDGGRVIFGSFA